MVQSFCFRPSSAPNAARSWRTDEAHQPSQTTGFVVVDVVAIESFLGEPGNQGVFTRAGPFRRAILLLRSKPIREGSNLCGREDSITGGGICRHGARPHLDSMANLSGG